jgi:hypothetical protein
MKNILLILIIYVISANLASAQKVNIQMKMGYLESKIDYAWGSAVKDESHSGGFRPTFALSVDGQLYKGIYLGAEIGTCSYLHFMNFSYKWTDATFAANDSYTGWYKQEQVYFTINPQYRFGRNKIFVVGGGAGVYNNYVNSFVNGSRNTTITLPQFSNSTEKLEGKDYLLPNTNFGGFINASINPKLNNIGLILEMRYIFNNYSANGQITKVQPDIRFNSVAALIGLSFHF